MGDAHEFNLVDEPWVRVRLLSGETTELSLLDVFRHAPAIATLVNDLPTQDFAILRVLLAILLRSVMQDLSGDEEPTEVWSELWNAGDLPIPQIESYLAMWRHRFDLFDEAVPFMQVAGMHTSKNETTAINRIVADLPEGEQLFTMRFGSRSESLSYAEAARWLIHVQAFDTAGIKSGVVGDPDGESGRNYPKGKGKGKGWAGSLGGVYIQGDSLRETLLLNLVLWDSCANDDMLAPLDDTPVWEQPPKTPGDDAREPHGYADILTWQSRRVLLFTTNDCVNRVILTYGDRLDSSNRQGLELMTAWERSEKQKKKPGTIPVFMPIVHQLDRAFWRSLASVLPESSSEDSDIISPGVIDWISCLVRSRAFPKHRPLRLHAVGMVYGTRGSFVSEVIDDTLVTNSFLLGSEGCDANNLIREVLGRTDSAVRSLGSFAKNLRIAAGDKDRADSARHQPQRDAYHELGGLFRPWLAGITEDTDLHEAELSWNGKARHILWRIADELMRQTDPTAVSGHKISKSKHGDPDGWMTASKAEATFRRNLYEALPISDDEKGGE